MKYSKDQTIDRAVRELLRGGDWVLKHNNRHPRIENIRSKLCITVPYSPSDPRAVQNWMHQIRRLGVRLEPA